MISPKQKHFFEKFIISDELKHHSVRLITHARYTCLDHKYLL